MKRKTLSRYLIEQEREHGNIPNDLRLLLEVVSRACKLISHSVSKGALGDVLGGAGTENIQGEAQKKLDVLSNEILLEANEWGGHLAGMASEEMETIYEIPNRFPQGEYLLVFDPLDGSSNIDVNVSVGTIFSIYRRVTPVGTPVTEEDFLQPGNKQVAAGYVVYGSSTMLVYTTGCGVHAFTYDPSLGVFCLCQERMRFPEKGKTYSINEGNYIKFPNGVKKYIKFCQEEDKSTNRPYTSRYIGSLVADFHRNLLKGGIYLYPSTASHPDGKLRLLYECNPMAFLAEQAGGKASDGKERILDIIPETLHQRRSFFVGNDHMVEDVERFIREFPDA